MKEDIAKAKLCSLDFRHGGPKKEIEDCRGQFGHPKSINVQRG